MKIIQKKILGLKKCSEKVRLGQLRKSQKKFQIIFELEKKIKKNFRENPELERNSEKIWSWKKFKKPFLSLKKCRKTLQKFLNAKN